MCNSTIPALLLYFQLLLPYFIDRTANNVNDESLTGLNTNLYRAANNVNDESLTGLNANIIRHTSFILSTD